MGGELRMGGRCGWDGRSGGWKTEIPVLEQKWNKMTKLSMFMCIYVKIYYE